MMTVLLMCLGMALLVAGAEVLVRSSSRLALALGVKPLLIGLIIVAYGTGTPEIAIMIDGMIEKHPSIGLGNVIGTNILNILFILGICALIAPINILQKLVKIDVLIMIVISVIFYFMALDGELGLLDGWVLFLGMVGYTLFTWYESRKEKKEVVDEYVQEFGRKKNQNSSSKKGIYFLSIFLGIVFIAIGAHLTVVHSSVLARSLGISELIIGLTLVALGTSLPEITIGVMAMVRKEHDIATGTVIGSNIVNILGVVGISIVVTQGTIAVPQSALAVDIPFMIVVAMACLPIFTTGHRVSRWEGVLLLGYFILYMGYIWMKSVEHDGLLIFTKVLMGLSLPLALAALFVVVKQSIHRNSSLFDSQ